MNVWPRSLPLGRESSAANDVERTVPKSLVSLRGNVQPGVPLSQTWSAQLVMPAQPARVNTITRNNSKDAVLALTLKSAGSFGVYAETYSSEYDFHPC